MLKEDIFDILYKIYLVYGAIHYVTDTLLKIHFYGTTIITDASEKGDICKLSYTLHHIFTFVHFKSLFMLDHYSWFMAFPPAYHNAMVAFPVFWANNYFYGSALFFYVFHQLYIKELRETRLHRSILIKCPLLIIPIIMMATAGECTEMWSLPYQKNMYNEMYVWKNYTSPV